MICSYTTLTNSALKQNINIEYNTVDLGFHLRHSFFLNEESRIVANVGVLSSFDIGGSTLTQTLGNDITNFDPTIGINFGAGYEYKNWILEGRFSTLGTIDSDSNLGVSSFALTIGYAFIN